jgi:hypothetical protein
MKEQVHVFGLKVFFDKTRTDIDYRSYWRARQGLTGETGQERWEKHPYLVSHIQESFEKFLLWDSGFLTYAKGCTIDPPTANNILREVQNITRFYFLKAGEKAVNKYTTGEYEHDSYDRIAENVIREYYRWKHEKTQKGGETPSLAKNEMEDEEE